MRHQMPSRELPSACSAINGNDGEEGNGKGVIEGLMIGGSEGGGGGAAQWGEGKGVIWPHTRGPAI